jgi:hypothetical protein
VRGMPFWVTSLLTLLVCAYGGREYYPAKKPPLRAVSTALSARMKPNPSEITAAAPEDPGEVNVVGPLAVWMQEANAAEAKKKPATPWQAQPMDHIFADAEMPKKYLRANFALNKSAQFRFVIPPHIVTARLQGSFRAFVRHGDNDHSGRTASIDLLLMNAQQFDDFVRGRAAEATFELESADHEVDFALPGAHDQPEEYHLVFRDPALRANLFVTADFTVNAE